MNLLIISHQGNCEQQRSNFQSTSLHNKMVSIGRNKIVTLEGAAQLIKFWVYFLKITSSSFINFKFTWDLYDR
jgi:hypothetical protein